MISFTSAFFFLIFFFYFHFTFPFSLLPSHRKPLSQQNISIPSRLCPRMTCQTFRNNINSLLHSVCQPCCPTPCFLCSITYSIFGARPFPLFASSSLLVTSEQFALSRMTFLLNITCASFFKLRSVHQRKVTKM
jgi:hypothetical protein